MCPFGDITLLDFVNSKILPLAKMLPVVLLSILLETFLAYVTEYVLESSTISIYQEFAYPSIPISNL